MKTQAAQCAAAVRRDLKELFPGVKFSVTSTNFSGGNSVDVDWCDGPTVKEVEPHLAKYEYGHFDGMNDMYEYSNVRSDIPQTKYLRCQREMSPETRQNLEPQAEKIYNAMCEDIRRYLHAPHTFLHRIFYKASLKPGEVGRQIVHNDITAGLIEDFYVITA